MLTTNYLRKLLLAAWQGRIQYFGQGRAGGRSKIQPRQEEGCQVGGGTGRGMCPLPREAQKLLKYM